MAVGAGGKPSHTAWVPYDEAMAMTNAVVLIEAGRDALSTLGGELADIEGVAEAYSVTGEWDFVAIVRVPDHEQLADVVTTEIGGLAGRRRARRRWSPSRPSRATTSKRCSRSGSRRPRAMGAVPIKPEYGPTLGRLLSPRWRAASRLVRGLVRGRCARPDRAADRHAS